MKIVDWFLGKSATKSNNLAEFLDIDEIEAGKNAYIKKLAVETCINLIAKTISCCEFLVYEKGKEVKDKMYYKLNVEPNLNQNSAKFWHDVVSNLINKNECLIIKDGGSYFVCDSFEPIKNGIKANKYTNIVINNTTFKNTYSEQEIWHLELNNKNIKTAIDSMHNSFNTFLKGLNKAKKKLTLDIPTSYPQTPQAQADLENLLKENMKNFLDPEKNSVLPLADGLKLSDLTEKNESKDKNNKTFIDIIEKEFEYTAIAFGIPKKLFMGEVADTDKLVDNLITFTINPLAKPIADEINRKHFKEKAYLEKNYVKLDTSRIKHSDIAKVANALDILTRVGVYSINDCLRELGREEINEPWANERHMTKNYEVKGSVNQKKGGSVEK